MKQVTETYLGDGLYAIDTGDEIEIWTERNRERHYVVFDDLCLSALILFLERTRNLKITITKTGGKNDVE